LTAVAQRITSQAFKQFSRLTVMLDSQQEAYNLNGNCAAVKQFDIVAVCPATEKLFAQCCEKLDVRELFYQTADFEYR
jgi:RNase P/RNase MRP subunit p30